MQCRVADRVSFLGRIEHEDLNRYYSAADVLVLASFREGWPNVLLEAMACGTPVVATAVGAVPDFVDHPHAGRVVRERSVLAIAAAVKEIIANPPTRGKVRGYAEQFSWENTTKGLLTFSRTSLMLTLASTSKNALTCLSLQREPVGK